MHKLQTGRGDDGDVTRCDIDTLCGNTPEERMVQEFVQGEGEVRHGNVVKGTVGGRGTNIEHISAAKK